MPNFKQIVTDLEFDNDIEFPDYLSQENPTHLRRWVDSVTDADPSVDMSRLRIALEEQATKEPTISKEDLKEMFILLKARAYHPCGEFDTQGRFYLDDAELVDVRTPSTKYPYSQMHAGRSAKFVKAIAEKYKCANLEELQRRFKKG